MKKKGESRESDKSMGVFNAGYPTELYKKVPCSVGYKYIRLQADGTIIPCCIASTMVMGPVTENGIRDVWFSDAYSVFREKTERIHEQHFHVKDPEWGFCQQCSHLNLNKRAAAELGYEKELAEIEKMAAEKSKKEK